MVNPGYKRTEIGILPTNWELALLTDKCELLNGLTYTPDNVQDNGLLVLRSSNIQNGQINLGDTVFVSCMVDKEKYVKKDDILICVRNGSAALIGKCAKADRDYYATFGAFMAVLRGQNNDFIFQLLQQGNIQKHINKNSDSTINQITNADFKSIVIPWPSEADERETIATALSDIDALITNLEKLIAKKKAIKQGAMQELLTGNRRLPGFDGEWKQLRIGDVLSIGHGMSQHKVETPSGRYPILATGGIIGRSDTFLWNQPSVLIGRKGTIDKPQYMETPFWTIDTLFYTRIKEKVCAKFIYYVFCMVNWYDYNEASGVPSLSAKTIESIEIHMPCYEEQNAIANLLTDMDVEIEEHIKKLIKYQNIKCGMMSELLTGRIRLV